MDETEKAQVIRCHNCGKGGKRCVVFRQNQIWCLDCRAAEIRKYPPLPEPTREKRPDVVVEYDGRTYTFDSKKGARKAMRRILETKKLPSEIADQLAPPRGRRGPSKKKKRTTTQTEADMATTITKTQLNTALKNLKGGSTLRAEATTLGLSRGKPLRIALVAEFGADEYRAALSSRPEGAKPKKEKKAAKPKAKAAAKPKAKASSKPKAKAAAKKSAAKKKVVRKPKAATAPTSDAPAASA